MIKLNKINYFTGDYYDLCYGLNKYFDFLDLDNNNLILLSSIKDTIYSINKNNKVLLNTDNELENFLSEPSNLFRVDIIVINFYFSQYRVYDYFETCFKMKPFNLVNTTNIKIIIISSRLRIKNDWINNFKIKKISEEDTLEYKDYYIINLDTYNKQSIESIKKERSREIKLTKIFDNKNK